MGTTANLSLGRTPCDHSGTQTMEACEELLQATSHSPPYLTCHGRLSGDSFSLPPEASCPVLLGIELQNMKPLSCRLELAPQQWGIPQLLWQTYSPFCFGVIFFGTGHKDHGKLASVTAYVSNNLSESKFGYLNPYQ